MMFYHRFREWMLVLLALAVVVVPPLGGAESTTYQFQLVGRITELNLEAGLIVINDTPYQIDPEKTIIRVGELSAADSFLLEKGLDVRFSYQPTGEEQTDGGGSVGSISALEITGPSYKLSELLNH